ncbi:unnamed protein product [Closterium sp. NIES-65]|nr:unnamed protein product [Closterium sp. NIES-65]
MRLWPFSVLPGHSFRHLNPALPLPDVPWADAGRLCCLRVRALKLCQVSEEHVEQVVEVMGLAPLISLTTDIAAADAVLALRSKLKGNAWLRGVAKFRHLPIYAVKANTASQVVRALRAILNLPTLTSPPPSSSSSSSSSSSASYAASPPHSSPSATLSRNAPLPDVAIASSTPPNQLSTLQDESSKGGGSSSIGIRSSSSGSWVGGAGEDEEATRGAGGGSLEDEIDALEEARMAAESMMGSAAQAVDLLPRAPRILSLQLQLINDYPLSWQYTGSPPTRRIRILPLPASARSELAPAVICRSNSPVGAIGSVGSGVTSGGERMGWQGEQEDVEMVEGGGGVVESGGCVVENAAAAGWTVVSLPRKVG